MGNLQRLFTLLPVVGQVWDSKRCVLVTEEQIPQVTSRGNELNGSSYPSGWTLTSLLVVAACQCKCNRAFPNPLNSFAPHTKKHNFHAGHVTQQDVQVQLQHGLTPWLAYKGKWGSTVEAPALQEWFAKAENPVSRSWLAQARLCCLCRSLP